MAYINGHNLPFNPIVNLTVSNVFSTTETVIGTYGTSDVYRKVLTLASTTETDVVSAVHGISNLGTVLHLYGSATMSDYQVSLPELTGSGYIGVSSTEVMIGDGSSGLADLSNFIIILEYTKTA